MAVVPKLKNVVWERLGQNILVMVDRRQMLTVADPDGRIEALMSLLADGTRSASELADALSPRFPDVTAVAVAHGIEALDRLSMLEDATPAGPLSAQQRIRFASNLAFFGAFATLADSAEHMQRRLIDARVAILGVGGLGSTILMQLVGAGVGHLTLVDHDVVELVNFARQFIYRRCDLGRPKVERAAEWVREFDPDVAVRTVSRKLGSAADIAALLDGIDLVVAAVDTPPLEVGSWINAACVAAGVPFVRGGMGVQSAYYSVDPGRGPCHECERGTMLAELDQPTKAGARWRLIMRLRQVNPGIGPVAGAIGAAMAMETIRYLTGFAEPVAAGVLHSFDLGDGGAETLTPWPRRPDCPVCQPAGSAR